jgi:signal transduction histidine kinase
MNSPTERPPTTRRGGFRLSLGYRLFLSLIISMGLLVTLLLLAASREFEELEKALGSERNHAELALLHEEWQRNPGYLPISVAGQQVWLDDDPSIPGFLKDLPRGFDDEIEHNGRSYSVLVAELDGHRITIASESEHIEEAEDEIGRFLQASWILLMLAIAGIGWLLVRHLIRPISEFADKIDRLDPSERGVQLELSGSSPEIDRMARAFNRYLSKMDEYVERQHAFAAMASHELRSPLTVVQTSAELIDNLSADEAVRQQSQRILRSGRSMEAMIHALLAVTRDHQPQRDFETVNLRELIHESLERRQQELKRQGIGIELSIAENESLSTHRALLQVVFDNLLDNAIRHSDHGLIRIAWKQHRRLCIRDQGPGVDEDALEDLFERGVSRGSQAGYGLGLYISRLISDRMGWQLELKNTGAGTEACLRLPSVG